MGRQKHRLITYEKEVREKGKLNSNRKEGR
jgi:hypothetical protein